MVEQMYELHVKENWRTQGLYECTNLTERVIEELKGRTNVLTPCKSEFKNIRAVLTY